jgi:hypothetical protein
MSDHPLSRFSLLMWPGEGGLVLHSEIPESPIWLSSLMSSWLVSAKLQDWPEQAMMPSALQRRNGPSA